MSRVWTKEDIKGLIESNDEMVRRGILAIFALQTRDEKESENTTHNNGVGFNGMDGEIMSSFARQLKDRGTLSRKQLDLARKKLVKYAGQMERIASGELYVSESDLEYNR
jgi:hypothetical protein